MSEVKAPPEVLLCVLAELEGGALEVDQDGGEEVVVNIVTAPSLLSLQISQMFRPGIVRQSSLAPVFLHQQSDVSLGQDGQKHFHFRLLDHHEPDLGALLLRSRQANVAAGTSIHLILLTYLKIGLYQIMMK